jgi:hypothetical protein
MTVFTLPAQPGQPGQARPGQARPGEETGAEPRPVPWQGMLWVTWRQQRAALVGVAVLLGAATIFLVVEGRNSRHDYAALLACRGGGAACQQVYNRFYGTDWHLGLSVMAAMQAIPMLLGAFTGPSVLARELETRTFRFTWFQGIGRVRWTVASLTLLAVVLTAATAALSQLYDWFYDPLQLAKHTQWFTATLFDTHGIVFAAWTLTAFCLGAFLGMLLRHTVPAMTATLGAYLVLALATWQFLRDHYPVSTFWPMQLFEAGWLLVLSILLIAATVSLVRRYAV